MVKIKNVISKQEAVVKFVLKNNSTIWHAYRKDVLKYIFQNAVMNSCRENCDGKKSYMYGNMETQTHRNTDTRKNRHRETQTQGKTDTQEHVHTG